MYRASTVLAFRAHVCFFFNYIAAEDVEFMFYL